MKDRLITLLAIVVALYFFAAFIEAKIDFRLWPRGLRFALSFCWAFIAFIIANSFDSEKEEK